MLRTSCARLAAAAAVLLAACASARRAAPPPPAAPAERGWARQAFAVQDRGRLLLSLPPGWTATEGERGEAGAPAIRVDGRGGAFTVLLTPLWNPGGGEEDLADTARLFADIARHAALSGSVEREIPLEELSAPGVKGFWFAATDRELVDRAPGPGEWRHIVQGAAAVGEVLLAFTLLDNGPGAQRGELIEVVRSARHAAGEADETSEVEPVPEGRTVPLRVAWPGKSWAVLVDLPGFTAGVRRAGEGRGPFVLGVHPATGIVASVALLPAGAAADADGCREQALAAIASAIPDVSDVRRADAARGGPGPASRASYTVAGSADGGVVQQNAHAFLHRDGLCANVHVSKANPEPGDGEAIEAILATVRFGEEL